MIRTLFTSLLAVLLPGAASWAAGPSITVEAGEYDRSQSILSVPTADLKPGNYELHTQAGVGGLLQVSAGGQGTLLLNTLSKGGQNTFSLKPISEEAAAPEVKATQEGDLVRITAHPDSSTSLPILDYQTTAAPVPDGTPPIFSHGAHIHPVYSPGGKITTGNHPPDHPHHRGIWMSWTKTEYEGRAPDFWNMGKDKSGKLTGEIRFGSLESTWQGRVHAGFTSSHRWIDHTGGTEKDVLQEAWKVTAYAPLALSTPVFAFDLESTQNMLGSEPLKLPKYHYGGLGVRGNAAWDPVEAVTMLTSEGLDRIKGDSTKARWVHLGGIVDGGPTGIAVLIHPENFRAPQPLRLNPKNPQLSVAPSQEGDWAIEPGKPYLSRYRFIVTDGPANAALLNRLWNDYAHPAKATLTQP